MSPTRSRADVSFQQATLIIGLEIHVQLDTKSKLFCGCSTQFGAPSNTQTCPVCAGMPGALPVVNEKALSLAVQTGLALHCEIAKHSRWDRKNYFYPDLPKGYQITQLDQPICGAGFLDLPDPHRSSPHHSGKPRRIAIERAHLEEDAGKSIHDVANAGGLSKIDLNRAGVPLLEIVTQPELRSPAEAKAFLIELKLMLMYLATSRCVLAHGNLRCDANINLHIAWNDETAKTPIVEIKNLNSFRAVERALTYEAQRQFESWQQTGVSLNDAPKQTRGWDDRQQVTLLQREKESTSDYRFFPEPNLPPVLITTNQIDQIESALECTPLPSQWREFLTDCHRLRPYDAEVLIRQGRGVIDYFLSVVGEDGDSRLAGNWITQEVLRHLHDHKINIEQYPITPEKMSEFLAVVASGDLAQTHAKEALEIMSEQGLDIDTAIKRLGINPVDSHEIEELAQWVIDQNPEIVQEILGGNAKAIGALIGQARKANPHVNPGPLGERIKRLIGEIPGNRN